MPIEAAAVDAQHAAAGADGGEQKNAIPDPEEEQPVREKHQSPRQRFSATVAAAVPRGPNDFRSAMRIEVDFPKMIWRESAAQC